jgi:hypothetical protein
MSPQGVDDSVGSAHDFDDADVEGLIAGAGADVDPRLAETIGDMRAAYAATPPALGAALAALLGNSEPLAPLSVPRFERMRSSIIAKVGAATAAIVAATSGLAVAGALPAPVQNALSHIGVGNPHDPRIKHVTTSKTNHDDKTTKGNGSPKNVTRSSTTAQTDNHGGDVSNDAHDPDLDGCEHGGAVAAVASDGKPQGKHCPATTTTVPDANGKRMTATKPRRRQA